jgi:hypothetical protein
MVGVLKLYDRVKGKKIDIQNFAGVIVEVIPRLGQNIFRVNWDSGQSGNYLAKDLKSIILPPQIIRENVPREGALGRCITATITPAKFRMSIFLPLTRS